MTSSRQSWRAALLALAALGGGDQERGMQLLQQGKFAEAAAAFRAAIEHDGANAELSYNLALALWRAGQAEDAETAAEQAAALSGGALGALRDGLVGNLRFDAARRAAEQDVKAGLGLAEQARDHYLRGVAQGGGPELVRNVERAQALIDELKKKLEEQQKQDQQKQDDSKQDEKNDKKDQDKKDQDKKDHNKDDKDQKDQPPGDQKGDKQPPQPERQPPQGEPQEPPEPKSEPQPEPEPQDASEPKPQPAAAQPQPPAPGEQDDDKQLTPEQKQRLLEKLQQLDQQLLQLRKAQAARRPRVEKDW